VDSSWNNPSPICVIIPQKSHSAWTGFREQGAISGDGALCGLNSYRQQNCPRSFRCGNNHSNPPSVPRHHPDRKRRCHPNNCQLWSPSNSGSISPCRSLSNSKPSHYPLDCGSRPSSRRPNRVWRRLVSLLARQRRHHPWVSLLARQRCRHPWRRIQRNHHRPRKGLQTIPTKES